MIVDIKTKGSKQIRAYKVKVNKNELNLIVEDILSTLPKNKNIQIEVK